MFEVIHVPVLSLYLFIISLQDYRSFIPFNPFKWCDLIHVWDVDCFYQTYYSENVPNSKNLPNENTLVTSTINQSIRGSSLKNQN